MTNRLGQIRADNVKCLIVDRNLTRPDFYAITKVSLSTIGNCFGDIMKSAPSEKTIRRITTAFEVAPDAFDKPDFDTATAAHPPIPVKELEKLEALPVVIEQTKILIQIGKTTIETEVDTEQAARILKLVVLGEDTL